MRRTLNHTAMPAAGFIEPWSVRAGETTRAFVSCSDPEARISIQTLDLDDAEIAEWSVSRANDRFRVRDFDIGSWVEIPVSKTAAEIHLDVEILFTLNSATKPVVCWDGFALTLDASGDLWANGELLARVDNEFWYRLHLSARSGRVLCGLTRCNGTPAGEVEILAGEPSGAICLGAEPSHRDQTLNARIGRIVLDTDSRKSEWRFQANAASETLMPIDGGEGRLSIRNAPTFAVASPRFTGEIHDPRLAPYHFDAIHLHDDDFGGFDWEADLAISVPEDARSGVCALVIETIDGIEKLPFFVRASRPASSVAFLLPTATYLAYADEQLPPEKYPWHGTDRAHRFATDNNFLSLYDVHADLSGVSLTSSRRPRTTLRDDYHYPLSNSPHLLSVDLQFLKFCHRHEIAVDVLTDHDLHEEGAASLASYDLVLTGSHPEYWSAPMMAGLKDYLRGGGNFAYLGGNGFYWVVAIHGHRMELRRGKNDIWTGRPGETHLAMTGEPGGNWEDRGLNHPQALVGVTYVIMGFGQSRSYRRLSGSYSGEYAWLFEGVTSDQFGGEGTVLGGAAGYEIDAVITSQVTPKNLVRLAVADGFDDAFQVRPDLWIVEGDSERAALRRADMTAYRHEGGGIVVSMSSVAWIGALPGAGHDNDVGRIMRNLIGRFQSRL
ncbi:N,N-dimethylformamidase beta subunit family domain-containing protein [Rhizobium sp. Root708]|uniref:N,N-dimethylformamidase beta subunit family domain-containing protein n=1 Tax=Rhizobium sp. Root708 TaxID=1736592 RepID=UPI000AFE9ACE|nr:N,N-dimethylformamidase beta subunit family domain-containing protein [Rhizobium sp. Root708]